MAQLGQQNAQAWQGQVDQGMQMTYTGNTSPATYFNAAEVVSRNQA